MHRVTLWQDDAGNTFQVAVACLDKDWELHAEVTEQVGPFEELDQVISVARARAEAIGGWHAHQKAFF